MIKIEEIENTITMLRSQASQLEATAGALEAMIEPWRQWEQVNRAGFQLWQQWADAFGNNKNPKG